MKKEKWRGGNGKILPIIWKPPTGTSTRDTFQNKGKISPFPPKEIHIHKNKVKISPEPPRCPSQHRWFVEHLSKVTFARKIAVELEPFLTKATFGRCFVFPVSY